MNTNYNGQQSLAWARIVAEHVSQLRFGTIQITVQEGKVVQIEKTEKIRFDRPQQGDIRRK